MTEINEMILEQTTIDWFESLCYVTEFGPDLAFNGVHPERSVKAQYSDAILEGRLRTALHDINPNIPPDAISEVALKITRTESPSLIENNRRFHRMLTDSVDVKVISEDDYDSVRHVEEAGV